MSEERKRALEKVKKLMRLSKSSNENEAGIALRQAIALMRKYNLDEDDVTDDKRAVWKTRYGPRRKIHADLALIIWIVQKAFHVTCVLGEYKIGQGGKWPTQCALVVFYGRGASAELARYAAGCIQRVLDRDRMLYLKSHHPFAMHGERTRLGRTYARVWLSRVANKVHTMPVDHEMLAVAQARMDADIGAHEAVEVTARDINDPEDYQFSDELLYHASRAGDAFELRTPINDTGVRGSIGHEEDDDA